jgi:hypothetical protein
MSERGIVASATAAPLTPANRILALERLDQELNEEARVRQKRTDPSFLGGTGQRRV